MREVRKITDFPKEVQEEINMIAKFENEHNTFLKDDEIKCDYVHCAAGMGVAGNWKCFLKGNGKIDCPCFKNEDDFIKEMETYSHNIS